MQRFYQHLEEVLLENGFLDPDNPRQLMRRLRRLFNRAVPDENEINILRGILSAVQNPTGKKRTHNKE
jgi:tRNA C32,U32 (ribose-2'-O)-methylase TrmJ